MDRDYGDAHYTSCMVEDRPDGYAEYDLVRVRRGKSCRVARILYWDAERAVQY
jgi:hypothetical protein